MSCHDRPGRRIDIAGDLPAGIDGLGDERADLRPRVSGHLGHKSHRLHQPQAEHKQHTRHTASERIRRRQKPWQAKAMNGFIYKAILRFRFTALPTDKTFARR